MNLNKYIGLPYKNLGRDFNGVDCWGLVYLVFKEEKEIILPDYTELKYDEKWYKNENHILDNISNEWLEVHKPYQKFDALIFYNVGINYNIANHIGLYIGEDKILHILENRHSAINRLDQFWLSKLFKGMRFIGKSNI